MFFIVSLVLLFIIKIRFPRHKSIAEVITERYGRPVLQLYRCLERQDYKKRKVQCDTHFLKCCLSQNLIPNFLKFKLPNRNLRQSSTYRNCQRDLLRCEIRHKSRALVSCTNRVEQLKIQLKTVLSWIDFVHCVNLIEGVNSISISRAKFVQERKLKKLGYVSEDNITYDNVIFNYSDVVLTEIEKKALCKGLSFSFPPKKINFINHFLQFEKLFHDLSNLKFYDPLNKGFIFFKQSLSYLAHSAYYSFNPYSLNQFIDTSLITALKNLSKKENLVVCKPDKGNGVVLLNRDDYETKMNNLLADRSKFVPISTDPYSNILKNEDKVNRCLRKLKGNSILDDSTFQSLYCSGSKPGIMYGLPKVHKDGCPMRPILSAIGTHNYRLARFLVPILAPITMSEYCVKDSFSFAKEVVDLNFTDCIMASFDVKSLFTNIPLIETIDICTNNLFINENETILNFNKKQMKEILTLAANDCMFLFNNKFYIQVDGCAMGSPIGPTFANAFLSHYEKLWLRDCPLDFKPVFYRRYVDDTFLLFREQSHINKFLEYLNCKHDNIEFTAEIEIDNSLPFLDIKISKSNDGFKTSVYRKPTFTGLCTKFSSFIPIQFKRNLVRTITYRAIQLSSCYNTLHKELSFIRNMLLKNGFPLNFTDTYIGKVLTKQLTPNVQQTLTVCKKTVYFSIPYTGSHSFDIRKKLNVLLGEYFPQVTLRVVFKSTNSIKGLFNIKDKIPDELRSCVIYKFECAGCSATYIGKCARHIKSRYFEHMGRSHRTGNYLGKPPFSAIRDHCHERNHPLTKENFSVLATARNNIDLTIMEALFQNRHNPSLGRASYELCCF